MTTSGGLEDPSTEGTRRKNHESIIVPLSCSDPALWRALVQKSKRFRLDSLQESPEAFASGYDREVAFTDEVWEGRLANPQATMLVAVDIDNYPSSQLGDVEVRRLVHANWMAATVLIQPQSNSSASLSANKSPWASTMVSRLATRDAHGDALLFILNGVYVAPGYRGRGIGRAIVEESFAVGTRLAKARGFATAHFQVRVDADNNAAKAMYKNSGFTTSSEERLMMPEKSKARVVIPAREATILVMDHFVAVGS